MLRLARSEILEIRTAADASNEEAERQRAIAKSTIDNGERALKDAHTALGKKDIDIAQLRKALEKQKSDYQQAAKHLQSLQWAESKSKQVETALKNSEEARWRQQQELSGAQTLAATIQANLTAAQTELTEKTKTVRLLRHEVNALRSSTSWKLTKPIRAVRKLLTRPRQVLYRLVGNSTNSGNSPSEMP